MRYTNFEILFEMHGKSHSVRHISKTIVFSLVIILVLPFNLATACLSTHILANIRKNTCLSMKAKGISSASGACHDVMCDDWSVGQWTDRGIILDNASVVFS